MFFLVFTVNLQGTPAILTVPILTPCLRAEQIHITVDTHTGMLNCHVPKHLDCALIADLQNALNNDQSKLLHLISELRYWITVRRCEKTLQHLPATCHDTLPLRFSGPENEAKVKEMKHRVFIKLHRHPNMLLIVELKEKKEQPSEMSYTFYLAQGVHEANDAVVATAAVNGESSDPLNTEPAAKLYFKLWAIGELDTFVNTHGPGTYVDEVFVSNAANLAALGKRKGDGSAVAPPVKQQKTIYPAYFIDELAHIVAMCDEKLPLVNMAKELSSSGIPHSGMQVEANTSTLGLKILALPKPQPPPGDMVTKLKCISPPTITTAAWNALMKRVLGTTLRISGSRHNQSKNWTVELVLYSSPLPAEMEPSLRRSVIFHLDVQPPGMTDKSVKQLLEEWAKVVYLYVLVHDFAENYKNGE